MQDEHFMRQWNRGHETFTADLHDALTQIGRDQRTRQTGIGSAYGFLDKHAAPRAPKPALSPAAQASLRGLAASLITFVLWVTAMMVMTPDPGLAATLDPSTAVVSACVDRPALA